MAEQPAVANLTTPSTVISVPSTVPFITKAETSVTMRCQDNLFKKCAIFGESGETLFTVECPGFWSSYSWRRHVRDYSGRHLFDLRRGYTLVFYATNWIIESPKGDVIGRIRHNKTFFNFKRSSVNITFFRDRKVKEKVELRHVDIMGKKTQVKINGVSVADIVALENNDFTSWATGDVRGVWKAQIASGVDLNVVRRSCMKLDYALLTPYFRFWLLCYVVRKIDIFGGSKVRDWGRRHKCSSGILESRRKSWCTT